jgi:hypothetical protein
LEKLVKQNQPISELLDGIASFYAEKLCTAWTSLEEKRWDNLLAFLSSVESVIGKIEQAENGRKGKVLVESFIKVLHLIDRNDFIHSRSDTAEQIISVFEQADQDFDIVTRPQPRASFLIDSDESLWISAIKKWKQWTKTTNRDEEYNVTDPSDSDNTIRWTQQFDPHHVAFFQLNRTLSDELVKNSDVQMAVADSLKKVNQLIFYIVTSGYTVDEDEKLKYSPGDETGIHEIENKSASSIKVLIQEISETKKTSLTSIRDVCDEYRTNLRTTFDVVDTIEISRQDTDIRHLKSELEELGIKLQSDDEAFLKTKKAFTGHFTLYKELTELQINSLDLRDELYVKVNNRFKHLLFGHTEVVVEKLQETGEKLKTIGKLNEEDIQKQNDALHKLIEKELLGPLSDTETIERFGEEVDLYKTDIQLFVNERSTEITIPTSWNNDVFPPKITLRNLSWSQALNRIFYEQHLRSVDEMPQRCAQIIQETRKEVLALTESLEVNLLAAIDLLDQSTEEEEKDSITYESINRILTQFTELLKDKKQALTAIQEEYKEQIEDVFAYLFSLLKNEKLDDLHQREKELQVKGTAIDWKTKISAKWAKIEDRSILLFRFIVLKGRNLYHIIAPWVGFEPLTTSQDKESKLLGDYLDELDAQFKSLPYIYRKVFDVYNQRDLRFFTGYGSELQMQVKHFDEWKKGSKRAINVLGEIGSGKTTYLDKFISNLSEDTKVERIAIKGTIYEENDLITFFCKAFGLNPTKESFEAKKATKSIDKIKPSDKNEEEISTKADSGRPLTEEEEEDAEIIQNAEELIEWLNSQPPFVIVLEGIHNLFLKVVEGFGALELFYLIVSETAGNVHWVTSINRHSWEYLDKVVGMKQFYSQIVATDNFSVDEIQQVIEKRHSTTGFQIRFEPDAEMAEDRAYKKVTDNEEERQNYLKKRIFQNIMVTAKGNISIALLQWVRSVQSISKLEMVFKVKDDYTIKLPDSLTTDDLFTLAYFVQQGNVKIEEHALSFRQSVRRSRAQISKLTMQSLILKDQERDSYSLNPLVYRPVIRTLTSKNILH